MAIAATPSRSTAEVVWRLDNLERIGGNAVTIIGGPQVATDAGVKGVVFDGVKDGLLLPSIPFAGAQAYTIEILFQPVADGLKEQRFLHAQDTRDSRALIETRLDGKGAWWLDTFITTDPSGNGVTLVDPKKLHPLGRWYWAALRYDGKTMSHFVNGQKEVEKAVTFAPFAEGQTSLGVRQNRVFWFKGTIREVRFHRVALSEDKLQRAK